MKSVCTVVPFLALLACAGCYSFQPAPIESLLAGSAVRAHLNQRGVQQVAALTGESTDQVDGTLVRTHADTVVLSIWRADLGDQLAFDPGRVQLLLQRQDLARVAERRISYLKTGALAAGIAGGLYLLIQTLWDSAGGGAGGGNNGGGRF